MGKYCCALRVGNKVGISDKLRPLVFTIQQHSFPWHRRGQLTTTKIGITRIADDIGLRLRTVLFLELLT